MQTKITRLEYLKATLAALDDDPTKPWSDYPCLLWPFKISTRGYGLATIDGHPRETHLISYEFIHGSRPSGATISHHCRNAGCFRPIHLIVKQNGSLGFLLASLAALNDDFTLPWSAYPCLEWPYESVRKKRKYPTVWRDGVAHVAHRLAYELIRGPIPEGYHACHHCDLPRCFRPSHIFAGSQKENLQDASRKGRMRHGEGHYLARLSNDDVLTIRRLHAEGLSQHEIARRFAHNVVSIWAIVHRKTWKHI